MAKSIANFLVGIGLDTKDFEKGSRAVDNSLSGFRSKAGIAGSAIAAAFSAAGIAAIKAGDRADDFVRRTEKFTTPSKTVYDIGNAFRSMGGDIEDAIVAIDAAETALDNLRKGDASIFERLALSQADISGMAQAQDGHEFLRRLSDQMQGMQEWQIRSIQRDLGLSNEVMATLREGSQRFDELVAKTDKYSANLIAAAEAGRAYDEALKGVTMRLEEIGDKLSVRVLPQFESLLNGISGFLDRNRSNIDASIEHLSENGGATTAVVGGSLLASLGAFGSSVASKVGMQTLGKVAGSAASLGRATTAVGAGSLLWGVTPDTVENVTGWRPNSYIWENTPADAMRDLWSMLRSSNTKQSTPEIKNNIDLNIQIDGKNIESKIIGVIERREADTIEDVQSSVAR